MRTVGFLCFAVGALSADTSYNPLRVGYGIANDGNTQLIWPLAGNSSASNIYTVQVNAWQIPDPTKSWNIQLTLNVDVDDCGTCVAQKADVWVGAVANQSFVTGTQILTDATVLTTRTPTYPIEDATATSNTDFLIRLTCTACQHSAELSQLQARIVENGVDRSYGAFTYKDDSWTDSYVSRVGEWGPSIRLDNIVSSDYVVIVTDFLGADGVTDLASGGIVYYWQQVNNNWTAVQQADDSATVACVTAGGSTGCANVPAFVSSNGVHRSPKAAYTRGELEGDEQVTLGLSGTGTWYVKPFVTRRGTTDADVQYRIAIGLNKVPSAATGVVPSVLMLVLLALAALFA